jgi:CBS domain-containing protein
VVKEGRLVGIFTATDACRALAELLREIFPVAGEGGVA